MERRNLIPKVSTEDIEPKSGEISNEGEAPVNLPTAERRPEPPRKERSLFMKALLAFIIVGAIVGIGILLPIKLIPNASNIIATVFNSKKDSDRNGAATNTATTTIEEVRFTADRMKVRTGENVTISWTGPIRNEGEYQLQYPCADGVAVTLIAADGTVPPIACGEAFRFRSIDNTMNLALRSDSLRIAEIPLTFSYVTASGSKSKIGDLRLVVTSNGGTTTPDQTVVVTNTPTTSGVPLGSALGTGTTNTNTNTATNTGTQTSNTAYTAPVGRPDLAIRVIATGKLDKTTGAFIPTSVLSATDRVAVQFEIVNIGGSRTGAWNFSAVLPTPDSKVYVSGDQVSMASYGRIVFTLGFDNMKVGAQNTMTIYADPLSRVAESNESNNTAVVNFTSTGGTQVPTGKPDLVVEILGVGRMSGSTFTEDNRIDSNDRAAVRFKVTNRGGHTTSAWRYEVVMEGDDDERTYRSDAFQALGAGASATYTVAFDDIEDFENQDVEFEVKVDSGNNMNESSESNNTDAADLEIED